MPKTRSSSQSNKYPGCGAPFSAACAIVSAWTRRNKHNQEAYLVNLPVKENPGVDLRQLEIFSLKDLQVATDNFSHKNILGRGGFGTVYKGCLVDGSLVAVKRIEAECTQGELQFKTEVEMIGMAIHRNLVRLRGFCMTATERLLVYPYLANGSVASCLREHPDSQPPLSWEIRKRIALGAARGLAYLHDDCNPKIIHRDVKAENILLDEEFEALVGDFGLVKLMDIKDTNVTTIIVGTYGHIAPEYFSTGKSSEKTDIFSYGVTLLELISGQRTYARARLANDEDVMLLDWAKKVLQEKKLDTLVDVDLQGDFFLDEVEYLLQIALLCTRSSPMERPKMSEIVRLLSTHLFNKRSHPDPNLQMPTRSPRVVQSLPSSSRASAPIPTESQQMKTQSQASKVSVKKDKQVYLGRLECFPLREIVEATDNFNERHILGSGAFGNVYKGELPGGHVVAIKRRVIKEKQIQVTPTEREEHNQFQAEIEMIGKAVHRNLLPLLGFCVTPTEKILVYPLMVNGSVASWLKGRNGPQPLPWEIRKKIALGAAKGLAYLHNDCKPKIIHRDVKPENILLDEDFEAIVADFGLVKFLESEDTHVTTAVRGTLGYIAPEYCYTKKSSVRTDVYGYGATLMELISGKKPSALASIASEEDISLAHWVERILTEKKWEILVDASLQGNYVESEVERFIQVSLLCKQHHSRRPKMSEVLRMLEGDDDGLASRWEEWKQLLLQDRLNEADQYYSRTVNSTSNLQADVLSGPR